MTDIAARRLRNQRLAGLRFSSAEAALTALGAVQAQDFAGAKWGLGQRLRGATDRELDALFDGGRLLRTHVLRPTWHFVLPQDSRWLLELTAPRIRAGLTGRHRQLELDRATVERAIDALGEAVAGQRPMTRPELGEVLRAKGIAPEGQRLAHLVMEAELAGVLISGPRRGARHTYALLEERAPGARRLQREEALAELARRYFITRGPAQVQDFAWWSGLTLAEARLGLRLARADLERESFGGGEHWSGGVDAATRDDTAGHLLPNWDEYTVAYRDRAAVLHPDRPFDPALFPFGSVLANVALVGGRVVGGWRRAFASQLVEVEVRSLAGVTAAERAAVEAAAGLYGRFLERAAEVSWV